MSTKNTKTVAGLFLQCLLLVGATALVGCGEGDFTKSSVAEANQNNVQRVANCYAFFQMTNKGYMGPKDMEEFKKFLADPQRTSNMEMMGIDQSNLDSLFISERDNEPIKVRFSVPGTVRGSNDPVAFETTGVDGVRLVGFTSSKVREVSDQAEYDDMFSGKWVSDDSNRSSDAAPEGAADIGKGG
jgi:hypothetical protein